MKPTIMIAASKRKLLNLGSVFFENYRMFIRKFEFIFSFAGVTL